MSLRRSTRNSRIRSSTDPRNNYPDVQPCHRLCALPVLLVGCALFFTLLTGCRHAPPPTRGWVRLSVLARAHPNAAMLAALDRRIADLEQQRTALTLRSTLPIPPTAFPPALAPAPALPSPTPADGQDTLPAIHVRSLAELRQLIAREAHRQYTRQERVIKQQFAQQRAQRLRAADEDIRAQQHAISISFRRELTGLRLTANVMQQQAAQRPGRQELRDAAIEALRKYQQRLDDYQRALQEVNDTTRKKTEAELQHIDTQLAEALVALKAAQRQANTQRLTDEGQRLEEDLAWSSSQALLPDIRFPDEVLHAVPVPATSLADSAHGAIDIAQRDQQAALFKLTQSIMRMQHERMVLAAALEQDIRAAALAVAAQHGYSLVFDQECGDEITTPVRHWLATYWQVDK